MIFTPDSARQFSGRGRGQVLERARVCGSNPVSCSSASASIGMPSLEMLSYMPLGPPPPPPPPPARNGEAGQPYGSMPVVSTRPALSARTFDVFKRHYYYQSAHMKKEKQ
uniref:Uncharacterized protein n=1 Tax=Anopheles merus TaxID=30066 RepID=A0A182UN05_ANOME